MQPLQFGLTGREFQNSFNVEKYEAIAYMQPRGVELTKLVIQNWAQWASIVEEARWFRRWKLSTYCDQAIEAPGRVLVMNWAACGNVPLAIYNSAIWGFGIEHWVMVEAPAPGRENKRGRVNKPAREILRLQNVHKANNQRFNMWDEKLLRGCGIVLPTEYGELDRWLEPMWQQVCKEWAASGKHNSSK